ncbi:MAG: RodZ domain-containing protein [Pseudomonadota bacterium]|nr:RodZ domain-containing protein [Pseudomonadota bacterium]
MSSEKTETIVTSSTGLPGSLLRQAREEKGLTIDEMSAISNLTKQTIRGIESDNYSELAGLSFVRGYLKLYAKKLGINESTVLEPFDRWKAEDSGEPIQAAGAKGRGSNVPSAGPSKGTIVVAISLIFVLVIAGTVISYMESDESHSEVVVVSPQNQQSDLSIVNSPRSSLEPTADQKSNTAAVFTSGETTEKKSDSSLQAQEQGTEDTSNSRPAEESVLEATPESQTGGEAKADEEANPYQLAQTEPEPLPRVEKQPELEKSVEPPKVVKKAEETVKKPVAEPKNKEEVETPVLVSPGSLNQGGRVIAEASGLAPAPTEPLKTMQGSPDQADGLRVLSETVTGPTADQLSMGARGLLKIEFTADSWVEVRDARGRLVLADLMTPEKGVNLDTYGPIEVLVGAVSASTVTFNGETQDLKTKAYQDVARITLGAETN